MRLLTRRALARLAEVQRDRQATARELGGLKERAWWEDRLLLLAQEERDAGREQVAQNLEKVLAGRGRR